MLILFTSFPESVTSAAVLPPGEMVRFQRLIVASDFPRHSQKQLHHAPSRTSSPAGNCPFLRDLGQACGVTITNLYPLFPHP